MNCSLTPARAALASHLAAAAVALAATVLAGGIELWVGMITWLGPLVVLIGAGRRDGFARRHAVAALRFNASVALYIGLILAGLRLTTGSPYTVQFVPFLLFLNLLVAFNWLVFTAVAMQRAGTGQEFTYPMTLRRPRRPALLTFGRSH